MTDSTDEITGYFPEILEDDILPNAPNCEVFRKNTTVLMSKITDIVRENGLAIDLTSDFQHEAIIHLYSSEKSVLFKKYGITENFQNVIFELEMNALTYLGILVAKAIGVKSLEISNKLRRIEVLSDKLMYEINSFDITSTFTLVTAFSIEDAINFGKAKEGASEEETLKLIENMASNLLPVRFAKFKESLEFLTSIHERLARTLIGKKLQFGVRGPKTNSALDVWIDYMVQLWAIGLDRSISLSENKYEGREQFLRFLEDCMYPLHEELEADTIRNAFEKLREKGEFAYLTEKSN